MAAADAGSKKQLNPTKDQATTTPPQKGWNMSMFKSSCCSSASVEEPSAGTKMIKEIRQAIGDVDGDGEIGTWKDAKMLAQRASKGLKESIEFVDNNLVIIITALNLLKLAEETGEKPDADTIAGINTTLDVLNKVAASLNAAKSMAVVAGNLQAPTTIEAIINNVQQIVNANSEVRKFVTTFNEGNGPKIQVDAAAMDKVDEIAGKLILLYKLTNAVKLTKKEEVVADTGATTKPSNEVDTMATTPSTETNVTKQTFSVAIS